ncbi:chaperonin 10-like protein [Cadophora sp. MPI-SDFR-AT-0126]|nr:chaperonin 10-like protein [Leotiomycetes sp. MPI-SDFR-AT-0126]
MSDTMKALVTTNTLVSRIANLALQKRLNRNPASFKEIPVPAISSTEILVKVHVVALNPTDYRHIDGISPPGCIVGCDFAGEVAKVGSHAAKDWKVGDRVAGAVHGGLYPDRGSFAEFLKADGDLVWKVPNTVRDEEAATFGVSAVTAMLALNVRLGLPWIGDTASGGQHGQQKPTILVYAGSTAAGLFAIQIAKAAGYTVVSTASQHSFDLVREYGADAVFDYRSPNVAQDISKQHPDISLAVDCISEKSSISICDAVIGPKGGKVITVLPISGQDKTQGIKHELIMSYTLFGRAFQWLPPVGPKFPVVEGDRESLARFYKGLPEWIAGGAIKALPYLEDGAGFEGILEGLEKLRAGKISGKKLVVKL